MKIGRTVFFPFIGMRIYPGTPLARLAIDEKIIDPDDHLLEPKYYISNNIDLTALRKRANETGKRWVFPDEDMSAMMKKMRTKNKKGPLWEYLIQ